MPADEKVSRPTVRIWPGVVPLPESYIGARMPHPEIAEWLRHAALPEEFYLRELMDLDLASERAISEFAARWGDLGVLNDPEKVERALAVLWIDLAPKAEPHRRFCQVAVALRDITRIWLLAQGALSCEKLAAAWESPSPPPKSTKAGLDALAIVLNGFLRPFQMHVVLEPGGQDVGTEHPTLASLVALQLANEIARRASYTRCANERCGRLFSRQRGRAKAGQYRTVGVEYCSRDCALAQSQRDLRRRKRAAREEAARKEKP